MDKHLRVRCPAHRGTDDVHALPSSKHMMGGDSLAALSVWRCLARSEAATAAAQQWHCVQWRTAKSAVDATLMAEEMGLSLLTFSSDCCPAMWMPQSRTHACASKVVRTGRPWSCGPCGCTLIHEIETTGYEVMAQRTSYCVDAPPYAILEACEESMSSSACGSASSVSEAPCA